MFHVKHFSEKIFPGKNILIDTAAKEKPPCPTQFCARHGGFCCVRTRPSMLHVVEGDALSKDPVSPALIDENHRDEAGGGDGHDGQGVGG